MPTRWWPLAIIVLIGSGLIYAVQVQGFRIIQPARDFTIIVGLLNVAVYVWVRAWSRLPKTPQVALVVFLASVQGLMLLIFRLDEFAGDGRILFQWRWTKSPEQQLAEFTWKAKKRAGVANLAESRETDSPSFRGADRTGRYVVRDLNLDWNAHRPRELWRHPIGRGWSSFAVVGDFCVTHEQRGPNEVVVCYEIVTGNEVWQHRDETQFNEVTGGPGPRATPTIHAGNVFSFGATGILNCLDGTNGRLIWARKLPQDSEPLFGFSSSPLVDNQRVYITPGGKSGSIVVVDATTGVILWQRDSRRAGYSSPQLLTTNEENQVLVFDATGLHGYDAQGGQRRWTFEWGDDSEDQVNVCQPAILSVQIGVPAAGAEAHQLLISSGYGRGSALISVNCAQSGEWTASAIWRTKALKSKFSDIIVHEGHAYGLDEGILTCISVTDGTRRWKNGRYGYGQLILVNQTLLIQTESGPVVLVNASPEKFTELASLDALHERTWIQPVIAGTYLLLRSDREAVCFELPRLTGNVRGGEKSPSEE